MKLWDYECDTCGKREEKMMDTNCDLAVIPCSSTACAGHMVRAVGGKPSFGRHDAPSTPNECVHGFPQQFAFTPMFGRIQQSPAGTHAEIFGRVEAVSNRGGDA
jgi:hypothetical protein